MHEYMLSKIAAARAERPVPDPGHIIALMAATTAPTPTDEICDAACGTEGFLIAASEYLRHTNP